MSVEYRSQRIDGLAVVSYIAAVVLIRDRNSVAVLVMEENVISIRREVERDRRIDQVGVDVAAAWLDLAEVIVGEGVYGLSRSNDIFLAVFADVLDSIYLSRIEVCELSCADFSYINAHHSVVLAAVLEGAAEKRRYQHIVFEVIVKRNIELLIVVEFGLLVYLGNYLLEILCYRAAEIGEHPLNDACFRDENDAQHNSCRESSYAKQPAVVTSARHVLKVTYGESAFVKIWVFFGKSTRGDLIEAVN